MMDLTRVQIYSNTDEFISFCRFRVFWQLIKGKQVFSQVTENKVRIFQFGKQRQGNA